MDAQIQTIQEGPVARRRRLRIGLIGGGSLVAVLLAALLYATSGRYMSTDDASVMAAQTAISASLGIGQ